MKIEGKIENIVPSMNNAKSFSIILKGERYGYYDFANKGCPYSKGQEVSLEYKEDGEFKNIIVPKENVEVKTNKELDMIDVEKKSEIDPKKQEKLDDTVTDFKGREADKFELGMAKNNAAVMINDFTEGKSKEKAMTAYWQLVRDLYHTGKEVRKDMLGY